MNSTEHGLSLWNSTAKMIQTIVLVTLLMSSSFWKLNWLKITLIPLTKNFACKYTISYSALYFIYRVRSIADEKGKISDANG